MGVLPYSSAVQSGRHDVLPPFGAKNTAETLQYLAGHHPPDDQLRTLLRENAELCAALDQHAIVGRTDARGKITFVNDKFCAISKYSREELVGQDHRIINSGHHSKEFMRELWATIRAGRVWHGEIKNRAKDGSFYWVNATIVPFLDDDGRPREYVAIRTDITERKQTEEAHRLFRTLVDESNDIFEVIDPESGRFLDVNEKGCTELGCTRAEYLSLRVMDIDPTVTEANWAQFVATMRATGSLRGEGLHRRKDGTTFPIEFNAKWVRLDRDYIIASGRDITARKESEAHISLQLSALNAAANAIVITDRNGNIEWVNAAFSSITGYSAEEVIGSNPRVLKSGEQPTEFYEEMWQAIQAGKVWCGEVVNKRKDGRLYTEEMTITPVLGADGQAEHFVAVKQDVTGRKKLEQQVLRGQRMESIGTLAGGIAHDLNNSLGPIIMSLDLLALRFPDAESQELLATISSSAHKGADMVRQVLSFARGVEGRRMEVQVKYLIREMEKIANDTFLKHVEMRTIVPHDLWTVTGDPTQLHQVLMNLCVNARDAMPNGGKVTISAENFTVDTHYAGLNPDTKPGPYVLLQVEDTGTGIPADVIEKIFDPFFTTKEVGKGTGLGLSTSLGIVKSHGGFIRVYSEPGNGTKFRIYLPAQTEASPESDAVVGTEMPRGHGELILVVDDELAVREITQQTLESFGYRVLLAVDGADAVAVYAGQSTEIAAVLTDIMMPFMDGLATIHTLRRMNSQLPIIAASGLAANAQMDQFANLGVKNFLTKPYTAETLLKTLQQVLSGEAPGNIEGSPR